MHDIKNQIAKQQIMGLPSTFRPQPQKYSPKKFLIFLKKVFLIFREMELYSPQDQKISYTFRPQPQNFARKKFLTFFPKKTCSEKVSYIFSEKAFLILRKRNFSYISGKVYSVPWHNGTFLYFRKQNFLALYFSYISRSNFPSSKC